MSTELRRLYEMCGGLEKDALAKSEGERMVNQLWAANIPAKKMEVIVEQHAIAITFLGGAVDMLPIHALRKNYAAADDNEVNWFIGYCAKWFNPDGVLCAAAKEEK